MADKSSKIKISESEDNEIHSTKLQTPITLDTLGILAHFRHLIVVFGKHK